MGGRLLGLETPREGCGGRGAWDGGGGLGGAGRGGDTFGAFWSAAGGANWAIATYCPSLGPSPSAGGGAHPPSITSCPPSPSLAYPTLRFPWDVVPMEPPVPVSLPRLWSARRRATAHAVGQARPSGHLRPAPAGVWGGGSCWGRVPEQAAPHGGVCVWVCRQCGGWGGGGRLCSLWG